MNRIILFFLLLVFSSGIFAQVGTLTVTVLDSQAGSGLTATQVCGDTYSVTFTYNDEEVTYGTVLRGGLCWLDRNLGAEDMEAFDISDATGNNDERLYGDLFQWGRGDDGHQDRESGSIPGPVNQDVPGHGDFIRVDVSTDDWRSPQNNDLWQGTEGTNNP